MPAPAKPSPLDARCGVSLPLRTVALSARHGFERQRELPAHQRARTWTRTTTEASAARLWDSGRVETSRRVSQVEEKQRVVRNRLVSWLPGTQIKSCEDAICYRSRHGRRRGGSDLVEAVPLS